MLERSGCEDLRSGWVVVGIPDVGARGADSSKRNLWETTVEVSELLAILGLCLLIIGISNLKLFSIFLFPVVYP
jgi:hypothetical protein